MLYELELGKYTAVAPLFELMNDWRALLAPDISLHFVDEMLLARTSLKNLDALKQEMCSERVSIDDFVRNSFGVRAGRTCACERNIAYRMALLCG